jgi:hypothetical protein
MNENHEQIFLETPNYFRTNRFLKILRFLNLLEPDRNVLSLSKILVWLNIIFLIYVGIFQIQNILAVAGMSVSMLATLLNYAYRRYDQRIGGWGGGMHPGAWGGSQSAPQWQNSRQNPGTNPQIATDANGIPRRPLPGYPPPGA